MNLLSYPFGGIFTEFHVFEWALIVCIFFDYLKNCVPHFFRFIPPESIQIEPSIYRPTGSYWSRRNRIGSKQADVTKWSIFNIETYGKSTVLGDFRLRRQVCGKSEMSIEPVDSFTLLAEICYLVAFTAGLLSSSPRKQA